MCKMCNHSGNKLNNGTLSIILKLIMKKWNKIESFLFF